MCPIPMTNELAIMANHISSKNERLLEQIFQSSAKVFEEICRSPSFANFYGLRDFYAFVKLLGTFPMPSETFVGPRIKYAMEREFGMINIFQYF